ncbi:hypothetical protein [Anabaena catenula]|uniref:Uncharacterized protein n=1 Tax=Anabaena catenula FACHB-362 TaxID=2692877 RepID=A0ABR8JBH8_9NOST|nr:hypothetical protein [Anabaena catenula]MBD2694396.1 hypothetical protein [Anabaena catenula FACHB-362]
MSKSQQNKYFLNNPNNINVPLLRDELHKALFQQEFIIEIPVTENENIEITEKNANAKLKKVSIQELNYVDEKSQVERIWKINLEKDIPGISTSSKTTECAILVLQKYESSYRLNIILIELKSSIDNKELDKIEEKFSSAMSRVCMLLVLNNHLNLKQGYQEEEIYLDFKGILFYKTFSEKRKSEGENDSQLYSILQTYRKLGILTCRTILRGQDKIRVQCFCNQDNDLETEIRINLKDLL